MTILGKDLLSKERLRDHQNDGAGVGFILSSGNRSHRVIPMEDLSNEEVAEDDIDDHNNRDWLQVFLDVTYFGPYLFPPGAGGSMEH